jgi:hypothetical protein
MINRALKSATPRTNLRDNFAALRNSAGPGTTQARFHFRSLKRLCLPPRTVLPGRFAPGV